MLALESVGKTEYFIRTPVKIAATTTLVIRNVLVMSVYKVRKSIEFSYTDVLAYFLFDIAEGVWFRPMNDFLLKRSLIARVFAAVLGCVAVNAGRFRLCKLGHTGRKVMF